MILVIASLALMIMGIIIARTEFEFTGIIVATVFGTALVVFLIVWPIGYYGGKANVQQYNIVKQTIENSRSQAISDMERATLTTKIIEINQALASEKYWNTTIFDDFIYDGYANLDYLK